MWSRIDSPDAVSDTEERQVVEFIGGSYDFGLHVSVLEGLVFQRHGHVAIEKEERADAKFAAQADREPDSIFLSAVVHGEADAGKICAQECPHAEGQTARQPGEDIHRLKLLGVDVSLAGPIHVIVVLRSEGDVVGLAAFEWFLVHEAKFVFFLLVAW